VHGALAHNLKLQVNWVEAEGLEAADSSYEAQLEDYDGILVPGGFGKRGIEGMLVAIRYAREKKVPYFEFASACRPLASEFARNVCGLAEANSSEFDPATPHRVIYKLRELRVSRNWAARCGWGHGPARSNRELWPTKSTADRDQRAAPASLRIQPRVRKHTDGGCLRISGSTPDGTYVEMVEIPGHPYFIGCQFHPEFKSKPLEPHPLFKAFIGAAHAHGGQRRAEKRAAEVELFHRPEKMGKR